MAERFIKFIPSEEAAYLQEYYPSAFLLLCYIARVARRTSNNPDGLLIGDAILGNPKVTGLSRQQYRDAQSKLVELKMIEIISNGKKFLKREKSTIKRTIKGMLVNLCDSSIWDINPKEENQENNQRGTNREPTGNHKQERTRKNKMEQDGCCLKETSKEKSEESISNNPAFDDLSPSPLGDEEVEEAVVGFHAYLVSDGIDEKTIRIWIVKFGVKKLQDTILLMKKSKSLVSNPGGWIQKALVGNYAEKAQFVTMNREFAIQFKNTNKIQSLKINKTYCVNQDTGDDYQYNLNPESFKDILNRKYGR